MQKILESKNVTSLDHRFLLDFERTHSQLGVSASEFVMSHPRSREISSDLTLELIAIEVEGRLVKGEPIETSLFIASFPDLSEKIQNLLHDVVKSFVMHHCIITHKYGMFPCQFGEYTILEELGRGGMGIVYRARSESGTEVALKVLFFDRHLVSREAEILMRLDHPSICKLVDVGIHDGIPFHCQALIENSHLTSSRKLKNGIPQFDAARIAMKAAIALAESHSRGVLHFDVKPRNILIDPSGNVHLIDFGLARLEEEDYQTPPDFVMASQCGSPPYIAPESYDPRLGPISHASDIYALGVTLYKLLTGKVPYRGSFRRIQQQICEYPAPRPRDFSGVSICQKLEEICLKAIAKHPSDRFASMNEFSEALRNWILDDLSPNLNQPYCN